MTRDTRKRTFNPDGITMVRSPAPTSDPSIPILVAQLRKSSPQFEARVIEAISMMDKGASDAAIRQSHGSIVLRQALEDRGRRR